MSAYYYIGLDIHKRTISYCIKAIDGSLIAQGKVEADRRSPADKITLTYKTAFLILSAC